MYKRQHIWDARKSDWVKVPADEYSTGKASDPATTRVIVIGDDPVTMGKMEHLSTWGTLMRVQTLDIMKLVNALNDAMTFTPGEWKNLARRHGLALQDSNAERRRYGRYGKTGEKGEPAVQTATTGAPKAATTTSPEDK